MNHLDDGDVCSLSASPDVPCWLAMITMDYAWDIGSEIFCHFWSQTWISSKSVTISNSRRL